VRFSERGKFPDFPLADNGDSPFGPREAGTRRHRHTDTQTHRHTDTQTHRHTGMQQAYRHTDTQAYRHTDTQRYRHTDTQAYRHTDIQAYKHSSHGSTQARGGTGKDALRPPHLLRVSDAGFMICFLFPMEGLRLRAQG